MDRVLFVRIKDELRDEAWPEILSEGLLILMLVVFEE